MPSRHAIRLDWTHRAKDGAWFTQTRRCILTVTPPAAAAADAPGKWTWETVFGTRRKNVELGTGDARSRPEAQRKAEQCLKFMVVSEYAFVRDRGMVEK